MIDVLKKWEFLRMLLYKKTFPLGKGTSASRYIKSLDEKSFPPYTLLISEIPGAKNYHIEIILTDPMGL